MSGFVRVSDLLGQWRAGEVCSPALSAAERVSSNPHPLAPLLLLAKLLNCCLCFGSQRDQWCVPILHRQLESQPPRVFQLSLVSSPTNHQNSVQCGLEFPEQISRARCEEFLSPYSLPTPIFFLPPMGWDR